MRKKEIAFVVGCAPSIVLTVVLAEICMSENTRKADTDVTKQKRANIVHHSVPAGPNSVAPVSRPETVITADIIRCSMNGRASTMHALQ